MFWRSSPRPRTTAALIIGLAASAIAGRPPYADFDKVTGFLNKTNYECKIPADCPPSWSCFDPVTENEVAATTGYCNCYVTLGASGSDCQDRSIANATFFSVSSILIFAALISLLVRLTHIFVKLHKAKAFSMKKASNVAFVYLWIAIFGIALYEFSAFMGSTNTGSYEMWVDKFRPLGVALGMVFVLMCGFQITVVWMKLALSTQKKGGETEKKIKRVILSVRCIQGLVVLVVLASLASGLITIMRYFAVLMAIVLGAFFHFGGNMLGAILMPKEDPTIEAAVFEKRAEPAKKSLPSSS